MTKKTGEVIDMQDPYAAPSVFSDLDRYLIGEGRHHQIYERLGAQIRRVDETPGVNFSVWAPNARTVQVVGDFNGWDGRKHTARVLEHRRPGAPRSAASISPSISIVSTRRRMSWASTRSCGNSSNSRWRGRRWPSTIQPTPP
jgi:1,4-alpha-glucan branching enzyme